MLLTAVNTQSSFVFVLFFLNGLRFSFAASQAILLRDSFGFTSGLFYSYPLGIGVRLTLGIGRYFADIYRSIGGIRVSHKKISVNDLDLKDATSGLSGDSLFPFFALRALFALFTLFSLKALFTLNSLLTFLTLRSLSAGLHQHSAGRKNNAE